MMDKLIIKLVINEVDGIFGEILEGWFFIVCICQILVYFNCIINSVGVYLEILFCEGDLIF